MKWTNKYNIDEIIANSIMREYDYSRLTVTNIIDSMRRRILIKRHSDEIEVDVSNFLWAFLGNAVHWYVHKFSIPDSLSEEPLVIQVHDTNLYGKPDLLTNTTLKDYKTTSVWSYIFGKQSWENQLNVYAYMYRCYGFTVKKLEISAILRDWIRSKAETDSNYPPIPFVKIDIPLWDISRQKEYVEYQVALHLECEELEDDELPLCDEESRWHRPDKWAVKKKANKTAKGGGRVFDTFEEAEKYFYELEDHHKWEIEYRGGEDKRCNPKDCLAYYFCNLKGGKRV
jgi:hypothetical protein